MGKTVRVRGGVPHLNAALRGWPKNANKELRDEATKISQKVATAAQGIGAGEVGVIRKVAPSIRPKRDRYPSLAMGFRTPKWRKGKGQYAQAVVYGAEFGSLTYSHLEPWRGVEGGGYALWPAIRAMEDETKQAYADAMVDALLRGI